MTQLGIGVAALNHDSQFQAAYERGITKRECWIYTLEDCLNLIAKLPAVAARIYRNVYHPNKEIAPIDKNIDLVGKSGPTGHLSESCNVLQGTIQTCLDLATMRV